VFDWSLLLGVPDPLLPGCVWSLPSFLCGRHVHACSPSRVCLACSVLGSMKPVGVPVYRRRPESPRGQTPRPHRRARWLRVPWCFLAEKLFERPFASTLRTPERCEQPSTYPCRPCPCRRSQFREHRLLGPVKFDEFVGLVEQRVVPAVLRLWAAPAHGPPAGERAQRVAPTAANATRPRIVISHSVL